MNSKNDGFRWDLWFLKKKKKSVGFWASVEKVFFPNSQTARNEPGPFQHAQSFKKADNKKHFDVDAMFL